MSKNLRVTTSKYIDETSRVSFKFNGKSYFGYKGDTLASALLANDIHFWTHQKIPHVSLGGTLVPLKFITVQ